jgi:epoxyqueuosine reductase
MPTSISEPADMRLRDRLRAEAAELGFDAFGICEPGAVEGMADRLGAFLAEGRHGDMDWMEARATERGHPNALWSDARSVIAVGLSYAPDEDPMTRLERRDRGTISCYAQGADYHDVLKKRLKRLARWLVDAEPCEVKVFVDTAPVMEKPLAAAAGLGWQGKHTNLVSRTEGSWLFLGLIFTTLPLDPDAPEKDRCGSCRRCLDACPTDAFPTPYTLDARRCIAYLTIEHRGQIPHEFREAIGNRIYGCDDCLAVCPWNKFASRTREAKFWARLELRAPKLRDLAALDDTAFRTVFSGSPIKRTGRDRFVRNVLIAIGNSGDADLAPVAQARLGDPSPLVRGMAIWALGRLLPSTDFKTLRDAHSDRESDPDVRAEWEHAS